MILSMTGEEVFIVVRYDAPVRGRGTLKMPQSAAWHDGMMPSPRQGNLKDAPVRGMA